MTDAKVKLEKAQKAMEAGRIDECIELASSIVQTAPQLARLRLIRAQCHIAKGEIEEATGDLT